MGMCPEAIGDWLPAGIPKLDWLMSRVVADCCKSVADLLPEFCTDKDLPQKIDANRKKKINVEERTVQDNVDRIDDDYNKHDDRYCRKASLRAQHAIYHYLIDDCSTVLFCFPRECWDDYQLQGGVTILLNAIIRKTLLRHCILCNFLLTHVIYLYKRLYIVIELVLTLISVWNEQWTFVLTFVTEYTPCSLYLLLAALQRHVRKMNPQDEQL